MFSATMHAVEPTTQSFLEALAAAGGKPLESLSPTQARKVLVDAQASAKVDLPPADISQITITVDAKQKQIPLHIVRPAGVQGVLPAFMFFHGGGWVLGDFPTHERLVRDLVVASGAAAVFVDYTPSPEAHYPIAINQAYAATRWVAEHGNEINIDGRRLAIAGNSVGGNMAIAVALKAKAHSGPAIRFQLLLWPVTDAAFDNRSYDQFHDGYFLTRNMMKWFWDHYTDDPHERAQIDASPLRAAIEDLEGLPPTLIQTAEFDVLRDEGEAFGNKLQEAGVDVTSIRYEGMIHDFGLLNALSQIPTTRRALQRAGEELKRRLI